MRSAEVITRFRWPRTPLAALLLLEIPQVLLRRRALPATPDPHLKRVIILAEHI